VCGRDDLIRDRKLIRLKHEPGATLRALSYLADDLQIFVLRISAAPQRFCLGSWKVYCSPRPPFWSPASATRRKPLSGVDHSRFRGLGKKTPPPPPPPPPSRYSRRSAHCSAQNPLIYSFQAATAFFFGVVFGFAGADARHHHDGFQFPFLMQCTSPR